MGFGSLFIFGPRMDLKPERVQDDTPIAFSRRRDGLKMCGDEVEVTALRNEAGRLHCDDGPAVLFFDKFGNVTRSKWYNNGKLHRLNGPAVVHASWYLFSVNDTWVDRPGFKEAVVEYCNRHTDCPTVVRLLENEFQHGILEYCAARNYVLKYCATHPTSRVADALRYARRTARL